jgi:hypothetical protein
VTVGSIGPWATSPFGSAGGLDGEGKWTGLLALIGIVLIARHRTLSAALDGVRQTQAQETSGG